MVNVRKYLEYGSGLGAVAVIATKLIKSGEFSDPRHAWDQAASKVQNKKTTREKGCPKATFLGLCEDGYIVGIIPGFKFIIICWGAVIN